MAKTPVKAYVIAPLNLKMAFLLKPLHLGGALGNMHNI
jgi:hypothetical protein